jgi:hypothetical protein
MAEEVDIVGYGTPQELEFLRGLGSYSVNGPYLDKKKLFQGYLNAAELRSTWGKIDRRRVIAFAKMRLAELEAGIIEEPGEAVSKDGAGADGNEVGETNQFEVVNSINSVEE